VTTRTTTQGFFDPRTWTVSYVVWDHATERAAVIDPVLDFDFKSGHTSTASADRLLAYVRDKGLQVDWILETHAHADHLSGARYVQARVGGLIAIGENIRAVQATFKKLFNLERSFLPDGSQFDHLFKDGEVFRIGEVKATAMRVPGHTPADMAYLVDGSVFVGDTLFMPDVGSARADFPGGNARQLYASMRRLLALPSDTRCTSATTTRPRPGSPHGRPPSPRSAPATSMCETASARTNSWQCARRAIQASRSRRSSLRRFRSTCGAGNFRPPTTTVSPTCAFH